jgi:hypothetical protein
MTVGTMTSPTTLSPERPEPAVAGPWTRTRERGIWTGRDVVRVVVTAGIGVISAMLCWYQASGELTVEQETPWLVGSIAAAGLFVEGLVYWLIVGVRQIKTYEYDTMAKLVAVLPPDLLDQSAPVPTSAPDAAARDIEIEVVTIPGTSRFHRPSCQLVLNKTDVVQLGHASQALAHLGACPMCLPR